MKKTHDDYNNKSSRKPEHFHKTISPKKEFQLLYRQRQHLPTSQAYQSIIFMKSKKCQKKSTNKPAKSTHYDRKEAVEQLKRTINDLQNQIKATEQKKNKKELSKHYKTLKSTGASTQFGFTNENMAKTFTSLSNKSVRNDRSGTDFKKLKNALSPSKFMKSKQNNLISTKTSKNPQQVKKSNKQKKEKKKICQDFKQNSNGQYLMVGLDFLQIERQQSSLLYQRILEQTHPSCSMRYQTKRQPFVKEQESSRQPVDQDQQQIQVPQSSPMQSPQQTPFQPNVQTIKLFINSKAKIIQRWWRKVIEQKKNIVKPFVFEDDEQIQEDQKQKNNSVIQNNFFEQPQISPIKMADQMLMPSDASLTLRRHQQAAQKEVNTLMGLLDQLLTTNKISLQTYVQKKGMVQMKYHNEVQQNMLLQGLLKDNAQKAKEMNLKMQQDIKIIQALKDEVPKQVLDLIFGKDFSNDQNSDRQFLSSEPQNITLTTVSPVVLALPPKIGQNLSAGRQKSKGCHFSQPEKDGPSLYQKSSQGTQDNDYSSDFQEQQEVEQTGESIESVTMKAMMQEFNRQQQVRSSIDRRAAIQMGMLHESVPPQLKNEFVGIQTSLSAIHNFLLNFFKFYISYYRDQFLRLVNMPFGYSMLQRIKVMQNSQTKLMPLQDDDGTVFGLEQIITEQAFEQFHQRVLQKTAVHMTSAKKANFQFDKIHNKALFDAFNEALNHFRPYFAIDNPPYPWNTSQKALTFYYIAQENIQQVFEKTQFRVLKWSSSLCGLFVNEYITVPALIGKETVEEVVQAYRMSCHPMLTETRQERLNKDEKGQIVQCAHKWNLFDETRTALCIQIAQEIYRTLMLECVDELQGGNGSTSLFQRTLRTGLQYFDEMEACQSSGEINLN